MLRRLFFPLLLVRWIDIVVDELEHRYDLLAMHTSIGFELAARHANAELLRLDRRGPHRREVAQVHLGNL